MEWARFLPFLDLKDYSWNKAYKDFVAALAVTFMGVPQGIAYAVIAGRNRSCRRERPCRCCDHSGAHGWVVSVCCRRVAPRIHCRLHLQPCCVGLHHRCRFAHWNWPVAQCDSDPSCCHEGPVVFIHLVLCAGYGSYGVADLGGFVGLDSRDTAVANDPLVCAKCGCRASSCRVTWRYLWLAELPCLSFFCESFDTLGRVLCSRWRSRQRCR